MTQEIAATELSTFQEDAVEILDRLEQSGGVEVLTSDGKAIGVVMAHHVYDELVKKIEQAEITASIRKGVAAAAQGRVISAQQFHEQMAAEHGFSLDGPMGE